MTICKRAIFPPSHKSVTIHGIKYSSVIRAAFKLNITTESINKAILDGNLDETVLKARKLAALKKNNILSKESDFQIKVSKVESEKIIKKEKTIKVNKMNTPRYDAEYILEKIMLRKNWSISIRDKLQSYLEQIRE